MRKLITGYTTSLDSFYKNNTRNQVHRIRRLSILYLSLNLLQTVAAYTECNPGFYLSSDDCLPYWGGFNSSDEIKQNMFASKGTLTPQDAIAGWTAAGGTEYPLRVGQGNFTDSNMKEKTCNPLYQCRPESNTACKLGEYVYQTAGRWTTCQSCPQGYTCDGYTITQIKTAGTWSAGYQSKASTCAAGFYCPDTFLNNTIACQNNLYSNANAGYCKLLSNGYNKTSNGQAACGSGYYASSNTGGCKVCPAGFYCLTNAAVPVPCPTGSYSTGGAKTSSCTQCPYGYSCTQIGNLQICPDGYTSAVGFSICTKCQAGSYCKQGQQNSCGTNTFSDRGASSCQNAIAGFDKDINRKSQGRPCGLGSLSDQTTNYICQVCPFGFYCPNSTVSYTCSSDQYCPIGTVTPNSCPDWYDCKNDFMCTDGNYMDSTKKCQPCPAGFTCPDRSFSTMQPVHSGYYSISGVSTEFICPGGYQCNNVNGPTACSAGYFSEEGQLECTICPVNYSCPNTELDYTKQIDCRQQRGHYALKQGQTECTPADPGYYVRYGDAVPTACPSGTWSSGGSEACHECPPGYICPSSVSPQMSQCLVGTYNPQYNQVSCLVCPAGSWCIGQKTGRCPTYKYSYSGWGYCQFAPAGYYLTNQIEITLCPAGSYAIFGSGNSTLGIKTCKQCPVAHYCSDPKIEPQPCAPGTYNPTLGQVNCLPCQPGTYSLFQEIECHTSPGGYTIQNAGDVPKLCPPDTISAQGSSTCTALEQGYSPAGSSTSFINDINFSSIFGVQPPSFYKNDDREGGLYFDKSGTITLCNEGYYCPKGPMIRYPCPAGFYCPLAHAYPVPCPAGYFNTQIMMTSLNDCLKLPCPIGFYCNVGTKYPQPCVGYCSQNILTPGVSPVYCPAGTYAGNDIPKSSAECNICWEGHYCPGSLASLHTFPFRCPKGTYQPYTGRQSYNDCLPCPKGIVCPYYANRVMDTGLTCQFGYFCQFTNQIAFRMYSCPDGYYNDALSEYYQNVYYCYACPDGYQCPRATNLLYKPMTICPVGAYCSFQNSYYCPAGTYQKYQGKSSINDCLVCPAGYYCYEGTSEYRYNICPMGYYCPEGTIRIYDYRYICPVGTYSDKTGLKSVSECKICPLGQYCIGDGTPPQNCPNGTYSNKVQQYSKSGCVICPAGYYCPSTPTIVPIVCKAGTYSDVNSTSCQLCPVNYYCDQEATTKTQMQNNKIQNGFYYSGPEGLAQRPYHININFSCPPGYYCTSNKKYSCSKGTYQPLYGQSTIKACLVTPAGYFTDKIGSSNFWDNPCPKGMYCLQGTQSQKGYALSDGKSGYAIVCPKGTYRSQTQGRSLNDCGVCPAGYVCAELTHTLIICSPGYYCPQGSETMQACPTGTFGSGYGLTNLTDCSPCFGGRYCASIASPYISGICDQMYYCVQNSNTPVPLYKNTGNTTDFLGRVFPVGDECAAGGYCAAGSKFPIPCRAGYYNPNVKMEYESQCLICPQGMYCSGAPTQNRTDILTAMKKFVPSANPTGYCKAGYYCTGGAFSPKQFTTQPGYWSGAGANKQEPCATGTYNPFYAQISCLACPIGYYCPNSAMKQPIDCPQGYYCPPQTIDYTLYPCPEGYYGATTNLQAKSDCQPCTSGKYCSGIHLKAPSGNCTEGFYCLQLAITSTPIGQGKLFGTCPIHHWCATGVGMGTPSLPGFYSQDIQLGAQTKTMIPNGQWSNTVSTTSTYFTTVTMLTGYCLAGYYCPEGSTWQSNQRYNCTIGQSCPTGSWQATECAAGYYQPNPLMSQCYKCPAGFYCLSTIESDISDYQCPKGYYCPEGTSFKTQFPCPTGTYNDHYGATSLAQCIKVPPGYYSANTNTTEVISTMKCDSGWFCIEGATSAQPTNQQEGGFCTVGFYCPEGTPQMIRCTPGWRCTTDKLATPNYPCPAGYFCPGGTGNSFGIKCPPGYFCPEKSSRPTPCPAGTQQQYYMMSQISDCELCTPGYHCPEPATVSIFNGESSQFACQPGFYCPPGSVVATQIVCPIGYRCPSILIFETWSPISCEDSDQYQDETGSIICKDCPVGYYCNQTTATKCQPQNEGPNYYCPGGSVSVGKIYCNAGYYNYIDGSSSQNDCWQCPPGYFCPTNPKSAVDKIKICKQGYYCFEGVVEPTICPIGYYCPEGTYLPIACPSGFYGNTTGLFRSYCSGSCNAGYYCGPQRTEISLTQNYVPTLADFCINLKITNCVIGAKSATQNKCPQGNYCYAGTIIPTPCPIGTFSSDFGNTNSSDCQPCNAGMYCTTRGLIAPQKYCKIGYYCPAGSDTSNQEDCPAGYFCPANSAAPSICVQGTYNPNEIQSSCIECQPGWYCPNEGMLAPIICPVGYYCPASRITAISCPEGTFSLKEGLTKVEDCSRCPYGKYCPLTSKKVAITEIEDAEPCKPFYQCYDTSIPTMTETQMLERECTESQICGYNTIVPSMCPPGTYFNSGQTPSQDFSYCLPCPIDYYCQDYGIIISTLKKCPDGYVCMGGAIHPSKLDNITIKICDAGSYCRQNWLPGDNKTQNLCKVNYFNPKQGQASCQPCLAGFSCQQTGLVFPIPCPSGHYCPKFIEGSNVSNVVPCPAGTYSFDKYLISHTQCHSCPPAKYCEEGTSGFTGYCDPGFVCVGGASSATPQGTFTFNSYTKDNNGPCPIGHYCPYGSSYPRKCQAGTYQNELGQSTCKPCPQSYYCATQGLIAPTGLCDSGFYCISGSVYKQPYDYVTGRICAEGHYCIQGQEYPCEDGTYLPIKGQTECFICPPGYYCNNQDGTVTPTECPPGHYCSGGTIDPKVCPLGTYTQVYQTGLESRDQCADCPTGYFCDSGVFDRKNKCKAGFYCLSGAYKNAQIGLECPPGYYCESGTLLPTPCPDGLYSLIGAASKEECKGCIEGYYCIRLISSSAMIICPVGYYCPQGVSEPIPCPKGTYNSQIKATSSDNCLSCPAGTACDITGISDYSRRLCPPGYYCPVGTILPIKCPVGTFRPNQGGYFYNKNNPVTFNPNAQQQIAACFQCVKGYYCPTKATTVPELCPRGSYCLEGSDNPTKCPPGYYCQSGSASATPCPKGFYCLGGTDTYIKCQIGTYCPKGQAKPIPCPKGMYGTGSSQNFDINSGCQYCSRGQYIEEDLTQCMDCTPGYVCLGGTSSSAPLDPILDGGYKCPTGYYCPLGSFDPTPCPVGTYSKYEGSKSRYNCLPCKDNWYNDLPGQKGCKKCGPTSTSMGGSTTCTCVGVNRYFIKSLGSCLCATGYEPENNKTNVDSIVGCKRIVNQVCSQDKVVDLTGKCITKAEEQLQCQVQCPQSSGQFIEGTGLCLCNNQTDINEVCNSTCQQTMPKSTLGTDGILTVYDPITNTSSKIDPSTLPGYFGTFKCQTPNLARNNCTVQTINITDDGSFIYQFQANQEILDATITNSFTSQQRLLKSRKLDIIEQSSNPSQRPLLKNPALCIQQGDVVFFNIIPQNLSYPVYYKEAILNNNPNFDFGPFLSLEQMIQQGVYVSTFSFNFMDEGVFVFLNKGSGTITTITVVKPSQTCQQIAGSVSVSMVTKESLSTYQVQSQNIGIQPDPYFISLQVVLTILFVFIVIGLLIAANQAQMNQSSLISTHKSVQQQSIYYDEAKKINDGTILICFGRCKKKKNKIQYEMTCNSSDDDKLMVNQSGKYKDLVYLLEEFKRAKQTLKRQLVDREIQQSQQDNNENENQVENISQEDTIMKEIQSLLKFVKGNKDCLDQALGVQVKGEFEQDNLGTQRLNNLGVKDQTQLNETLNIIINQNIVEQQEFSNKIVDQTKQLQQEQFQKQLEQNDEIKEKIIDEFKLQLKANNIDLIEWESILNKVHANLSYINVIAADEHNKQDQQQQEMLQLRQQKKDKLKSRLNNLSQMLVAENDLYQRKFQKINESDLQNKKQLDYEMEQLRLQKINKINVKLQEKRARQISEAEQKLKKFKIKQHKQGYDIEGEIIFANKLADYKIQVQKLDADLALESQSLNQKLEDKMKDLKINRVKELEQHRKEWEQTLNTETTNNKKLLMTQIKQMEGLLNPIKDEEERMTIIKSQSQIDQAIITSSTKDYKLSDQAIKAQQELQQNSDKIAIETLLNQIDVENEVQRSKLQSQKDIIQQQIETCQSEDEKQRFKMYLEKFEANFVQLLESKHEIQNKQLQEAIQERRTKRKQLMDLVSTEKANQIKKEFSQASKSKVTNFNTNADNCKQLVKRIQAGFNKDECVLVTENFIDQKNQQESVQLMNQLFEEQAQALRQFMFDLLSQKQAEFDLLKEEIDLQKEFLRQKRNKQLMSLQQFTTDLELLTVEETERHQDIEISYIDKENAIKEELQQLKIEADNHQIKALKDRQTQERIVMFNQLMQNLEEKDQIKNYLAQSIFDCNQEFQQFKHQADNELRKRKSEIFFDKRKKLEQMQEKQNRLADSLEAIKRDETQAIEQYMQQREKMLSRKLADQQRDLHKDINQKDAQDILKRHQSDLQVMDEVLKEEQDRQMEIMRIKMKGRNASRTQEQLVRSIKLAELQKVKKNEAEQAKYYQMSGGDLQSSIAKERQKETMNLLVEKANIMQRMCQKQCYSRLIFQRRHIENQQKLNELLGRSLMMDWVSSSGDDPINTSASSQLTLPTQDLMNQFNMQDQRFTYAMLLHHIQVTEETYDQIRENETIQPSIENEPLQQSDKLPPIFSKVQSEKVVSIAKIFGLHD